MRPAASPSCRWPSLAAGCGGSPPSPETLTLATTTSTQDSGLLDVLVPLFREKTGIEVKVVAVGSGQALQLGRRGDADVILAHSPEDEERFMAEGHGESRRAVMHNDFVLVGPPSDPAEPPGRDLHRRGVRGDRPEPLPLRLQGRRLRDAPEGAGRSGAGPGCEPAGDWYMRAGAGMGQALAWPTRSGPTR